MSTVKARPDILTKAAEIIEAGGLGKGRFLTRGGRHCTVGALMEANGGGVDLDNMTSIRPEVSLLTDLLGTRKAGERDCGSVYIWNDEGDRTADEVVELLRQAAEKAEADL
jgi:hypothetical protein